MSVIQPKSDEYDTHDGLKVAKDVAWVIKSLWSGVIVVIAAAIWISALAADVHQNTEKLEHAATKAQMDTIIVLLTSVSKTVEKADDRQREMKSQLDKLESKVDSHDEREE